MIRPKLVRREVISKEGLSIYLMSDQNTPVFLDRLYICQVNKTKLEIKPLGLTSRFSGSEIGKNKKKKIVFC